MTRQHIAIRLPRDLVERIDRDAEAEVRPRTWQIEMLLRRALAEIDRERTELPRQVA